MGELLKLQESFFANVFRHNSSKLDFVSSKFAEERFNIYRHTIFENMRNALQISFPGIWNLLGEECANNVAFAYCAREANLPTTGCLDDFGGEFADFLPTITQLQFLPYLRDYAHYEWLKHLTYGAEESKPCSVLELYNIPAAEIDNIRFCLISACFLFSSQFPIDAIEKIATGESDQLITFSGKQAVHGIITRKQGVVHTLWMDEVLWGFIKYLSVGYSLSESAKYAQSLNHNFDLTVAMVFLIQSQLIHTIIK